MLNPVPDSAKGIECCPTCGGALTDDKISWDMERRVFVGSGFAIRLTPHEAKLLDAVWRTRKVGGVPNRERFMEMVYGCDADGGPESYNTISVHLANVRTKLAIAGYTISQNTGEPRNGYRLVKIAEPA